MGEGVVIKKKSILSTIILLLVWNAFGESAEEPQVPSELPIAEELQEPQVPPVLPSTEEPQVPPALPSPNDSQIPPILANPEEPQVLNPTIYYKPIIKFDSERCAVEELVSMIAPNDKVLTQMCQADFKNCLMQGACYFHDQEGRFRSFNYYARGEDGSPRFKEIDINKCPYGYGVRNACLDPYYSVAADLTIYKMGDVIFVPQIVGEMMPDGAPHDGYFIIRDAGGAIKGANRFDFYTGLTKPYVPENPFHRLGFANIKNNFVFRMATEEEAKMVREKRSYPRIPNAIMVPPRE